MFVADPPAIAAAPVSSDQADTIEVVGVRRDQVQKIDRRVYTVKDTPHAAQQDSIQLLRSLPAVTIGPDDQIMLLGSGSVTIQVDGQPVPYRNIAQFLGTLHGSDIERIEIITNPSAQYAAAGTGGIINFILRRKQKDGVSGSANAEARSIGFGQASGTLKYKKGKWTYETQVQVAAGRSTRSTTEDRRAVQTDLAAAPTIYTSADDGLSYLTTTSASFKVTRTLGAASSISSQTTAGTFSSRTTDEIAFRGLTPDFASFSERQHASEFANFITEDLSFDRKGARDGEELQASLGIFGNPEVHSRTDATTDQGAGFSSRLGIKELFTDAKLDWTHPIGNDRILSTGAQWTFEDSRRSYSFVDQGTGDLEGFNENDRFEAQTSNLAAYATYQQAIGALKVMPGVRLERYGLTVTSPGHPTTQRTRGTVFPTVHVERPLGKTLDLTLSYSKRIDRPDAGDLRPYPVVKSIDTISVGNPGLVDQSTDAFEANLHYHRKHLDAGVIIYDRETDRLFGQSYSVDAAGLAVITPINAGHKSDRGAEIDLGTPLWRRTKITASVNLFDSRTPLTAIGGEGSIATFRYSTNTALEWDGPDRGKRPGDTAQLLINYQSPRRDFDTRVEGFNTVGLSYTHSFSGSLSLTASADNVVAVHNRTTTIAPLIEDFSDQRSARVVRVKLLKRFGKP